MIDRQVDQDIFPEAKSGIGQAVDQSQDLLDSVETGETTQPAGTNAANAAYADVNALESGMLTSGPGIVGVWDGPAGSGPAGGGGGGGGGAGRGIGGTRGQPALVPAPAPAPAASLHSLINYPNLAAYRSMRGLPQIQAPQPQLQPQLQQRRGIGGALQGVRV